ncbi:poly(A) polymerase [Moraxella caviae]|uniref:Poly(A) polymerase I n=1 Tax=Moraxella caviae TaxID=34060 RepID=A0A1T0A9N5_9GAMM|nr:poly(A) polymerase [Moraxella caviae]STZ10563.1 Poly(A) polymerase precursor [Moraxella caviae]VEW12965.1 Poly(A) polymerase precursor [Moraxella caviae]
MARKPAKSKKQTITPVVHDARALGLVKSALPHSIVEVIGTLQKARFEAYIVGGGVRDSLLGLAPKDFDAVTAARPHEVKAVFGGRCRIIGRRFQLAHVYSGREMIEVATFRAPPKDDTHTTDEGMITRDNVWGTIEEDFARRDFSINALYYQPLTGEVLDFCGALDDVQQRRLRLLGNAAVRIEEDPVRLLRALRFKAKLGFDFDKALHKQFHAQNWALLEQVSAHRLYDETQKMFSGGYLAPLLSLLFDYGAMTSLMAYPPKAPTALMTQVAINSDKRINDGKTVNPAFFYAVLLWENYLHQLAKFKKRGLPFHEAQAKAAAKVVEAQRAKTAIPKFTEDFIAQIWLMQPKLANPRVRDIANLEKSPKFRAAFDFLALRERYDDCALAEPTNQMAAWWQAYQDASSAQRAQMIEDFASGEGVVGMKRRRKRGMNASDELHQLQQLSMRPDVPDNTPKPLFVVEGVDELLPQMSESDAAAPKKRHKKDDALTPRKRAVPVPVFEPVAYTEDDFLALLNNDEPYIPSQRYRKRAPSSALSIKERELLAAQGIADEQSVAGEQGVLGNAPKNTSGDTLESAPKKPRRRKKPVKSADNLVDDLAGKAADKTDKPADVMSDVGLDDALTTKAKTTQKPRRTKTAKQSAQANVNEAAPESEPAKPKKRRSRKSNAKPKADEGE